MTGPIQWLDVKALQVQEGVFYEEIRKFYFEYLSKPHPMLGRSGAVCPFMPLSLKFNKVKTLLWKGQVFKEQEVLGLMLAILDELKMCTIDCAMVVFFPNIVNTQEIALFQEKYKSLAVGKGLMIGEFFEANPSPGLHNKNWHPLQSKLPCLAFRRMVKEDFAFMLKPSYRWSQKVVYIFSYFFTMHSTAIKWVICALFILFSWLLLK